MVFKNIRSSNLRNISLFIKPSEVKQTNMLSMNLRGNYAIDYYVIFHVYTKESTIY